jgi:hypothetical protein
MDYYKIEKQYQDKKNNKQPSKSFKIICISIIGIIFILIKFILI